MLKTKTYIVAIHTSSQSDIQILPTFRILPHVHKLIAPHHTPTPSVPHIHIRIRSARTIPLAQTLTLHEPHTPVHEHRRRFGQLHVAHPREPVTRAVQARAPHAPVRPVPQIPRLPVLRLEPSRALADRRGVDVAHAVGAALAVVVALVLRGVPECGPRAAAGDPREALEETVGRDGEAGEEGLVADGEGVEGGVLVLVECEVDCVCVGFHLWNISGRPLGSSLKEKSPLDGSSLAFHDVMCFSVLASLLYSIFMPGKSVSVGRTGFLAAVVSFEEDHMAFPDWFRISMFPPFPILRYPSESSTKNPSSKIWFEDTRVWLVVRDWFEVKVSEEVESVVKKEKKRRLVKKVEVVRMETLMFSFGEGNKWGDLVVKVGLEEVRELLVSTVTFALSLGSLGARRRIAATSFRGSAATVAVALPIPAMTPALRRGP
ncbi:hypothetical protein G2W53_004440 [Senna tora]|uniref:Uncharacterized protein n=1 Tax=Senna tora TaxID=362788 RepID=A0A834XCA5_9FABA|nr:hypothetical protein G2W53_004440 [Senna tora]